MYRHLWKLTAKQRLLSHSITKTLQNGSRQLRTDRNLPRNSTDRPKDKVCVTGSDSFRKRVNRVLSRSRERNPKAEEALKSRIGQPQKRPRRRTAQLQKNGRINLLLDIQSRLQGRGPGYERWLNNIIYHTESLLSISKAISHAEKRLFCHVFLMLYVYFYGKGAFKIHLEGLIFSD